jgi:hypothetical protein
MAPVLCDREIGIAGAAYTNNDGKKKVPLRHVGVTAADPMSQIKCL